MAKIGLLNNCWCVRIYVIAVSSVTVIVFWSVTSYFLVEIGIRFRGGSFLYLQDDVGNKHALSVGQFL
jgi:hypothetical protein